MKIYRYITFISLISGIIISCNKIDVPVPEACLTANAELKDGTLIEQDTFKVGQTVIFKACAPASLYVLFTGERPHNYDLNGGGKDANYGLTMDSKDPLLRYTYKKPGIYKVVFIATNTEIAGEKRQSKTAFDLVILE